MTQEEHQPINRWNSYIPSDMVGMFTKIWGDAPFPKIRRLRCLSKAANPLARLKWLSQQLYRRRLNALGCGEISIFEFLQQARKKHAEIRDAIKHVHTGSKEVVKHAQNQILFDCGERGALEIRMLKDFKKRSSRFSYIDKNYEDEIEDLEANLDRFRPRTLGEFTNVFTPTIVAIVGFSTLLETALKRAARLIAYSPSTSNFYIHNGIGWVPDDDLLDVCERLHDALCFATKEMRELVLEKMDITSIHIPDVDEEFTAWFARIFDNSHSREFVNAFELVWLLEETDKSGDPLLYSFVRKEVIKTLSKETGSFSDRPRPPRSGKRRLHRRNEDGPKLGDAAFKNVFNPNAGFIEIVRTCSLFAKEWRAYTNHGKFRQNVVKISRW